MKPLHAIHRLAIGMSMILLIFTSLVVFITNESNYITPTQLSTQLSVDSVNQLWYARNIAYQDSLQLVYSKSAMALKAEATTYANRAKRMERIATEQEAELESLRQSAPTECKEVIAAYVEALDTCNAKAATWHSAYNSEFLSHKQTVLQVNSLNSEVELLAKANSSLKQVVTTQRDYITSVTNRSNRRWVFRNWKWMFGRWREYMLE